MESRGSRLKERVAFALIRPQHHSSKLSHQFSTKTNILVFLSRYFFKWHLKTYHKEMGILFKYKKTKTKNDDSTVHQMIHDNMIFDIHHVGVDSTLEVMFL
jgi:isocitrate dehydrogenase